MGANGGRRPGAGRKKGSPNKATIERQKLVAITGITPLDFMIAVLRDEKQPFEARFEAAKSAAPYVHPRLATVEVQADVKVVYDVTDEPMSEVEWATERATAH